MILSNVDFLPIDDIPCGLNALLAVIISNDDTEIKDSKHTFFGRKCDLEGFDFMITVNGDNVVPDNKAYQIPIEVGSQNPFEQYDIGEVRVSAVTTSKKSYVWSAMSGVPFFAVMYSGGEDIPEWEKLANVEEVGEKFAGAEGDCTIG